jgi:hypothetical protein
MSAGSGKGAHGWSPTIAGGHSPFCEQNAPRALALAYNTVAQFHNGKTRPTGTGQTRVLFANRRNRKARLQARPGKSTAHRGAMLTAAYLRRMVSPPLREMLLHCREHLWVAGPSQRGGRVAVAVGIRNPGLSTALPSSKLLHSPVTGRQYQRNPPLHVPNIPTGNNGGVAVGCGICCE